MSKNFLKSVPSSLRWLIQPALFIALGLHGLLLLVPVPKRVDIQETKTVKVDELPQKTPEARQSPVTRTPAASPKPSPMPPSPMPGAAIPKPTLSVPFTPRPALPQPALNLPVRSAPRTVPPVRPTPSPAAAAKASPSPSPTPSPSPSPTPTPAPLIPPPATNPDPVPALAIPFGDVPLLAGTQTGCFGLGTCHSVEGTDFRAAGQDLEAQFESQGYQVKYRDDLAETGHNIYEISKDGKTRYLNVLFSVELDETVYLITPQPVSLAELKNSERHKTELEVILDSFPVTTANPTQFPQPDAFFAGVTPRPETGRRLRLVSNNPLAQFWPTLNNQLQDKGFAVTDAGGYGSGRLYEVTKEAFTGYLNLVPTVDRTGTIVVLWSEPPA